jgi:Cdc6-like AAA superfamily ATPase
VNEDGPSAPASSLLSPDRPIENAGEDELGRGKFSRDIAQAISAWRDRDSLVFGLVGPWGDGKTSVKNLIIEELGKRAAARKPSVLEFLPWGWAAQDRIIPAFFRELSTELGIVDTSPRGRDRAEAFIEYGQILQSASQTVGGFPLTMSGIAAGVASLGASQLATGAGRTALAAFAVFCGAVSFVVGVSGQSLAVLGKVRVRRADQSKLSLGERKRQLAELMRNQLPNAPVLVVMDDLDRLDADELREVLQLIRANADLPNLVYLLLYDEVALVKILETMYPGRGHDALEKVVNLRLALPRVNQAQLADLAKRRVGEVVAAAGHRLDDLYWANLVASGWGDLIENMRVVKRFLNVYSLHLTMLTQGGTLEVNAADLAAVDLLSVVEPDLHAALVRAKDFLTRDTDASAKASRRSELQALIEKASEPNRQAGTKLLLRLFAPLSSVVGNTFHADFQYREWWTQRRVCSRSAFDIYFTLTVPVGEASGASVSALARSSENEEAFLAQLKELKESGVLGSALHQLGDDRIPLEHNGPILRALFRAGDTFLPTEPPVPLQPRDEGAAADLIRRLCRLRLPEGDYVDQFLEAMRATTSVYLPVYVASSWDLSPSSLVGPLAETSQDRLRSACLAAIQEAALDGRLLTLPGLGYLLFRWREWGEPDEVKNWLRARITTAEDVDEYARRLGGYHSQGPIVDPVHRSSFVPNHEALEELIGKDYLDKLTQGGSGSEPEPLAP